MAQPIVGSWFAKGSEGYVMVTFLADGTYFMAEDGRNNDPSGRDGMERGSYKWNATSKAFEARTKVDTNKEWGFSHFPAKSARINGSKLKLSSAREDFTLTRVSGSSKIVGGWYFKAPDGYGVVTVLADGTYMMAEDGDNNDRSGKDGMEFGTYRWNASTKRFSSKTTVDTNKEWGLSHADISKVTITGNKLVGVANDGPVVLKKVVAPGGAKKPEITVQQPRGSSLTDGKSKKSFGTVKVGKRGRAKTFTIKNTGKATLKGLAIRKNGQHRSNFIVGKLGATKLAPGEKTTFKVSFKPSGTGTRRAAIHISSNDADENPFDIKLAGAGAK